MSFKRHLLVTTSLIIISLALPEAPRAELPGPPISTPGTPAASPEPTGRSKRIHIWDARLAAGVAHKMYEYNRWGFCYDFSFMGRFGLGKTRLGLMPEAGYSFLADGDKLHDHYFVTGLGFGLLGKYYLLALVPNLVLGGIHEEDGNREFAIGYRTSLMFEVPKIVGLQVSHQILSVRGRIAHEFRFTLSIHKIVLNVLKPCFKGS